MRELGDGAMMGMLAMLASSGMARAPPHLLPPPLRSSSFSAACRVAPAPTMPMGPARARRRHRAPAALQALHLLLRRGQRRGLLRPLLALVLLLLGVVVVLARAVL